MDPTEKQILLVFFIFLVWWMFSIRRHVINISKPKEKKIDPIEEIIGIMRDKLTSSEDKEYLDRIEMRLDSIYEELVSVASDANSLEKRFRTHVENPHIY